MLLFINFIEKHTSSIFRIENFCPVSEMFTANYHTIRYHTEDNTNLHRCGKLRSKKLINLQSNFHRFLIYTESSLTHRVKNIKIGIFEFQLIYFSNTKLIILIIGIQPWGRSGQRPELSHATGMALVRCIQGKFLGVAFHCFPPMKLILKLLI